MRVGYYYLIKNIGCIVCQLVLRIPFYDTTVCVPLLEQILNQVETCLQVVAPDFGLVFVVCFIEGQDSERKQGLDRELERNSEFGVLFNKESFVI